MFQPTDPTGQINPNKDLPFPLPLQKRSDEKLPNWSTDDSISLYNVPYWGEGYFDINDQGDLTVIPKPTYSNCAFSIEQLTDELLETYQVQTPLLLRFTDIVKDRVRNICTAFNASIKEHDYQNSYLAVYPIKVNQHKTIVEKIIEAGKEQIGLESGSKAELMAIISLAMTRNFTIICNGYKDRQYIRLALLAQKLGHMPYIVVEKRSELELVLDEADKLGIHPKLGLRIKVATQMKGKWQKSVGSRSKFGLYSCEIFALIHILRERGHLNHLELMHFHLGSQISDIADIDKALKECGRVYSELRSLGAPIEYIDVGGGLGIDYEGSNSQSCCSTNYNIQDYADQIISGISDVCDLHDLPHPKIISESGRAITAHHALLVTNVIDVEPVQHIPVAPPLASAPPLLKKMWETFVKVANYEELENPPSIGELYCDAIMDIQEAHDNFSSGEFNLAQRVWAEQIHLDISFEVKELLDPEDVRQREILGQLNEKLADKLFLNFSVFRSLPDSWAIDQVFPVLPLKHLNKRPNRRAHFVDITCDSDGAINNYVDNLGTETTLPISEYSEDDAYRIGFFLLGAYQEILGDSHNLFGVTDTIDIEVGENGELITSAVHKGSRVNDMLESVDYEAKEVLDNYLQKVQETKLTDAEKEQLFSELKQGLNGYTYLEK